MSTSTPVGGRSPKAAKHNDDDASTPSDGESKATHDRTPALTDLAREILLLTKSRREVLQEFMDDNVEHVVSIWRGYRPARKKSRHAPGSNPTSFSAFFKSQFRTNFFSKFLFQQKAPRPPNFFRAAQSLAGL